MALDSDPYRILELSRGATMDEVKRAYRRLAKANHPDAAGEGALPRFLAIQAAYEQLIGGSDGRARGRRSSPARRPWEADPDRSDATRRAYGGRARSAPPGGRGTAPSAGPSSGPAGAPGTSGRTGAPGTGPTGDSSGPTGPSSDPAAAPGTSGRTTGGRGGPSAGTGGTAGRPGRRRPSEPRGTPGTRATDTAGGPSDRKRNKATLGSTSYDGADAGPFEPDWGGASWYGTTSGTYWTLNPKEYADPRKHGPEYQARARRTARARSGESAPDASAGDAVPAGAAAGVGPEGPAAGPTHTTSSWWESTAGAAASAGATGDASSAAKGTSASRATFPPRQGHATAADDRDATAAADPPPPDLGRAAADITQALTDERFGGLRGRIVRAVIGWLPIALGIGWIVGELTGCGRFAATCDTATDPLVIVLQVLALAVILLVPALAALTATAAVTLLAAAVATTLILSAGGPAEEGDPRRTTLGVVLVVAWVAGLVVALVRRARAMSSPTSPVS